MRMPGDLIHIDGCAANPCNPCAAAAKMFTIDDTLLY
jgi:hypothetical protein